MFGLGLPEIVVILVVVVVIFGPSRLPGLGKGLGEALGGFKKAISGKDKQEGGTGKEQMTPHA
jgi:sec-independent protein translocase protein TatA